MGGRFKGMKCDDGPPSARTTQVQTNHCVCCRAGVTSAFQALASVVKKKMSQPDDRYESETDERPIRIGRALLTETSEP